MATIWEPPLQEDGRSHTLLHTASNLRTSILWPRLAILVEIVDVVPGSNGSISVSLSVVAMKSLDSLG